MAIATQNGFAPMIAKSEFDNEAKMFLKMFCTESLITPMAIPILEIARKEMGLRVIKKHLSEDLSILGQMCFTSGLAEIYDKENEEYREVKVRYGTMIIDPDVIVERNEGCMNNTIAHECVHWHKHRDYHIAASIRKDKKAISRYCDFMIKPESTQSDWADEDWMEWQANNIAPRILMPLEPFHVMVQKFAAEYTSNHSVWFHHYSMYVWVVNNLAAFFKVSKQSVKIRLEETGYHLNRMPN